MSVVDSELGDELDQPFYRTLHAADFYGSPAWAFWVLCIATGVICGIVIAFA